MKASLSAEKTRVNQAPRLKVHVFCCLLGIFQIIEKVIALDFTPGCFWPFCQSCKNSSHQVTEVEDEEATNFKDEVEINIVYKCISCTLAIKVEDIESATYFKTISWYKTVE